MKLNLRKAFISNSVFSNAKSKANELFINILKAASKLLHQPYKDNCCPDEVTDMPLPSGYDPNDEVAVFYNAESDTWEPIPGGGGSNLIVGSLDTEVENVTRLTFPLGATIVDEGGGEASVTFAGIGEDFIPLSGTEVGSPVTGDIEIQDNLYWKLFNNQASIEIPDDRSGLIFISKFADIGGYDAILGISDTGISVNSSDPSYQGFVGGVYFPSKNPNTYAQMQDLATINVVELNANFDLEDELQGGQTGYIDTAGGEITVTLPASPTTPNLIYNFVQIGANPIAFEVSDASPIQSVGGATKSGGNNAAVSAWFSQEDGAWHLVGALEQIASGFNGNVSTTEVVTNSTYIDGKPIYRRAFVANGDNTTNLVVDISMLDLDRAVRVSAISGLPSEYFNVAASADSGLIIINKDGSYGPDEALIAKTLTPITSDIEYTFILEYTKTTD